MDFNKKKIAVLGSTGSIGRQSLEVIEEHPLLFEIELLTANNNSTLLIKQAIKFKPNVVVIANKDKYHEVNSALSVFNIKVYCGEKSTEVYGKDIWLPDETIEALKEYIVRGTYIYPPDPSMRLITDIFSFCENYMPKWNPISISGYHIREAGSTAAQEIGFTFANGIAYVQTAIDRGLDPNKFAHRLSFFFNSHNGFLEEIAKFRAAREIWAKIMKERFNVTNEKALLCRFHVQTGGSTLTAQQTQNNIVRTTIQAMSAILGGAQSLHTNAYDEALALPTDHSAKIALRTQQIIAYETGIPDYVDPLGNSEQIEILTQKIIEETSSIIDQVDNLGGAIKAIEKGWIQNEIAKSAYSFQRDIDNKKQIIIGLNKFTEDENIDPNLQKIDSLAVEKQIDQVKKLKNKRDNQSVKNKIKSIESCALTNNNLIPKIIEAAKAECTLGEISDALRKSFGEHNQV